MDMKIMNVKKRFLVCGVTLGLTIGLAGCQAKDENASKEVQLQADETDEVEEDASQTTVVNDELEGVDVSAGGWKIVIEENLRNASMENVSVVLGYTDETTSEFVKNAPEGMEYFLIKMLISKADSKETIQWDKMILKDKEGNEYNRCDDTFLSDLGMKRLPGTNLNFGSNEGWIAFEIKENAEQLKLQYEFENQTLEYTFK